MPQTIIDIYSDYVCPYCLLAEEVISGVLAQPSLKHANIRVNWHPFELRRYPTPTLKTSDPYLPSVWASNVYPMAARLGVPIKLPDISPQPYTNLAFEGHFFAKEYAPEKTTAYNVAVLRAFFQQERDIGKVEVLADVAVEVGLDQADFRKALEDRRYREAQGESIEHAVNEAVISSVPTLFVNGRRYVSGVPDADALRGVLEDAMK